MIRPEAVLRDLQRRRVVHDYEAPEATRELVAAGRVVVEGTRLRLIALEPVARRARAVEANRARGVRTRERVLGLLQRGPLSAHEIALVVGLSRKYAAAVARDVGAVPMGGRWVLSSGAAR